MLLRVTRDLKLVTEVRHIFLQSFNLICGRKSFPHRFVHIDVLLVPKLHNTMDIALPFLSTGWLEEPYQS